VLAIICITLTRRLPQLSTAVSWSGINEIKKGIKLFGRKTEVPLFRLLLPSSLFSPVVLDLASVRAAGRRGGVGEHGLLSGTRRSDSAGQRRWLGGGRAVAGAGAGRRAAQGCEAGGAPAEIMSRRGNKET
jgi:hypothetical protein